MREILQEEKAKQTLSSAFFRSKIQPQVRELIEKNKEKEAKKKIKQYMRNQEAYLQDIEKKLPYLEAWVKHHKEKQEGEIAPQRELVNREIKSKAASLIQSALRGHTGRQQFNKSKIDQLIEESIKNQPISPSSTMLSGATTVAEQEQAEVRRPRSDIGSKRAPYKKIKKQYEKLMESLTPEEKRMVEENVAKRQTRAQALKRVLQTRHQRPRTLQQIQEELEDTQRAKGSGFKRIRPKKRTGKASQEDKMKNRLRLIVAQMEAGNTNPKLIVEMNKLYKNLYDIDNAYMFIQKK